MKEKIGELENDFREELFRWMRKYFIGVVKGFSGKSRFLVRFQYGCEKDLTLNRLVMVTV